MHSQHRSVSTFPMRRSYEPVTACPVLSWKYLLDTYAGFLIAAASRPGLFRARSYHARCSAGHLLFSILSQCLASFHFLSYIVCLMGLSEANISEHLVVPTLAAASSAASSALSFPAMSMLSGTQWISTAFLYSFSYLVLSMMYLANHCPSLGAVCCSLLIAA